MLELRPRNSKESTSGVTGEFLPFGGERCYVVRNVDAMTPFFMSVVSNADHWLFVSSTGGLTAGRVSPETALFPYGPVDRIHDSAPHTGCKTILRVSQGSGVELWEPFSFEHGGRHSVSRNLYKNVAGNKLCFEEINHDLQLAFRYTWATSDEYGFIRQCELQNLGPQVVDASLLDGLQNILPAGTPAATQANASNLVDAYKWTELDKTSGLALYTLYSAISDRAEPCESLRANTVFCLGLDHPTTLLSSAQVDAFRCGNPLHTEEHRRGIRGAYFVATTLQLAPRSSRKWQLVANLAQSQAQVVALRRELQDSGNVASALSESVARGSEELARLMAATDALQLAAEENVVAHHYSNVLFNNLRGGVFDDQTNVATRDFAVNVRHFNRGTYESHRAFLESLPPRTDFATLLASVRDQGDPDLERLCHEYLPVRFGRRHGDPSRPWNKFSIRLRDDRGNRLFAYEGNWRDIFQNWEALTFSYPEFVDNVIARFVNASTIDGYNPYRINKEGIDWEVEEPDDPWSYIGYWGDHQIIYLLKLLELSNRFHPQRLAKMLHQPIFSYANVPYRIRPLAALLENPKSTVDFDHELALDIEHRVDRIGADGKLVLDENGAVYRVNLLEKLLVPLLAKLGNFVVDGGIWLNTQRPEWNDANNALVGNGLSMVTLYYLRRYVRFLQRIVPADGSAFTMSSEVSRWLNETATAVRAGREVLGDGPVSPSERFELLTELGGAASRYRLDVYGRGTFSGTTSQPIDAIRKLLADTLALIDHSIASNRREDGLFHAYNLLEVTDSEAHVDSLYPMLEGQVAALSAGYIEPGDIGKLLQALFESDIYRPDQDSFMLYPDRALPGFLQKNCVPEAEVVRIQLLQRMLKGDDERLVTRDADGNYRFHADFGNVDDLSRRLDELAEDYGKAVDDDREALLQLYEQVFNHHAFTGRSGGMFGFEGLGCIYWHMVSKLLLAIQENFFAAVENGADPASINELGKYYYRVRAGLGFNKTPSEYGAFPADPYSHTPRHAGAQQPGMTGQVKEEVLTRFGELGVRVAGGRVHFRPNLLRRREFSAEAREFCYLAVNGEWQSLTVPARGLAFTWCQVPVVLELDEDNAPSLQVTLASGASKVVDGLELPAGDCDELFERSGKIDSIRVRLAEDSLFAGEQEENG